MVHCSWFGLWLLFFYFSATRNTTFAHNAKCKNVQSCLNMLKHDYVSKSCLEFSEYNVRGFLSSKKSAIEPPFHIEPEDESE